MTLTREEVEAEHAALKAESTAWREQVRALVARVQHLEGRLATVELSWFSGHS